MIKKLTVIRTGQDNGYKHGDFLRLVLLSQTKFNKQKDRRWTFLTARKEEKKKKRHQGIIPFSEQGTVRDFLQQK